MKKCVMCLAIYCDGLVWACIDAGHAHDALVVTSGLSLIINHVIHVHGADIDAYAVSIAFVLVDCYGNHSFHLSQVTVDSMF